MKSKERNLKIEKYDLLRAVAAEGEDSSVNMNQSCHARAHTRTVPEISVDGMVGTFSNTG